MLYMSNAWKQLIEMSKVIMGINAGLKEAVSYMN